MKLGSLEAQLRPAERLAKEGDTVTSLGGNDHQGCVNGESKIDNILRNHVLF